MEKASRKPGSSWASGVSLFPNRSEHPEEHVAGGLPPGRSMDFLSKVITAMKPVEGVGFLSPWHPGRPETGDQGLEMKGDIIP